MYRGDVPFVWGIRLLGLNPAVAGTSDAQRGLATGLCRGPSASPGGCVEGFRRVPPFNGMWRSRSGSLDGFVYLMSPMK